MTTKVIPNPIFHYQAADKLAGDCWNVLVDGVTKAGGFEEYAGTIKKWEVEWKDAHNAPFPGAWRSAKSVILAAANARVPLLDGLVVPRGKSAVERDVRKKRAVTTPMDTSEAINYISGKLLALGVEARKLGLGFSYSNVTVNGGE